MVEKCIGPESSHMESVYGHHPIYSGGEPGDNRVLIESLLLVLRGNADIYLAGHDHDLQHLKPEGSLHFFVNGAGGAKLRASPPYERTLFSASKNGFATIEADTRSWRSNSSIPNSNSYIVMH